MFRRVVGSSQVAAAAPRALVALEVGPSPAAAIRSVAFFSPMHSDYPGHYNPQQKLVAGQNISLRMTDFYDGYTDNFGNLVL